MGRSSRQDPLRETTRLLPFQVISGFGGFYTVAAPDGSQLVCKGRGKLKKQFKAILTGDRVLVSPQEDGLGMIEAILPRSCELSRPHIANVDLAVIVLSWKLPDYDLLLLDNLILTCRLAKLQAALCFNKCDMMSQEEQPLFQALRQAYRQAGLTVLAVSAHTGQGLEELRSLLAGRVSVLAGPSGVGKTSLLNCLLPQEQAPVGEISERLRRGRHTTRYTRLLALEGQADQGRPPGMLADAPGFFVLDTPREVGLSDLPRLYPEYLRLAEGQEGGCRFDGCRHHREPGCAVRQAVAEGRLDQGRYQRYLRILQQIREREAIYP